MNSVKLLCLRLTSVLPSLLLLLGYMFLREHLPVM